MKVLQVVKIFFGIFFFELLTGWVRAYDIRIDVPISFLKYFLLLLFLISRKNISIKNAFIGFTSALVTIMLFSYIDKMILPLFAAPNFLSAFLGGCCACIVTRKKNNIVLKLILPALVTLFSTWYIFGGGFDRWCNFIDQGSFTGKVNNVIVAHNWVVYNKQGDTFNHDLYKGKVVYLDFWSTSCGVCFTKFPALEKLHTKYKNNPDVLIQAVNIPIERDTAGMAFYMIARNNKYSFPVMVGNEAMRKDFEIASYPTIVILKDEKIVFRGREELSEKTLEEIVDMP